ncbi:MAG: carbonic anhydrase, partial [Oscillospiraceae bacterium]|nr:carbonic anhydrase [Oscillospiraceae bacterium]
MKKIISLLIAVMLIALLFGCGKADAAKAVPASFNDSEGVKQYLLEQNAAYIKSNENSGDISADKRSDTAANGQHPYAVVVTCSDS